MNNHTLRQLAGALASCLLLSLVACSSVDNESGVKVDANKVSQIKKGVTSRAEVEALLGPPTMVSMMPEGRRVLNYTYTATKVEGHATAATYIPYVGLFAGGSKAEGQTRMQHLQIMVNAQGIVDDYEFQDNTTDMAGTTGGLMGIADSSTTSKTAPTVEK
jgi:outer membrane protein assembly factor BamE (lipoprotein component of BamABCDE complex)